MKALAVFASPVLATFALIFTVVVILAPSSPPAIATPCFPTAGQQVSDVHLDDVQLSVANQIIRVGRKLHVPSRGWVIALATGMQESGLRPLTYGDRDSLGVFQQRAAWGPAQDRINPTSAAHMFFNGGQGGQRGLLDIQGWQTMPLTHAAQAVQVSAYPDAYAKWETLALALVRKLGHSDGGCPAAGKWVFPLGNAHYVLTAAFGSCGAHWVHCHTGQDFAVPTGTPVTAMSGGKVTFAGWAGPYGNAVHILHADGVATWYCHLSSIRASDGDTVRPGQLIGLSGSTGNTTGPHLHLEVRTHASATNAGQPIDPMPFLRSHHVL